MRVKPWIYFILAILFSSAGLLINYLIPVKSSSEALVEQIEAKLRRELARVEEDFESADQLDKLSQSDDLPFSYPLYLFENNNLKYWSDNSFVPPLSESIDTTRIKLFNTGSEAYLLIKKFIRGERVLITAIKLLKKYPITNHYLQPEYNEKILPSPEIVILEPSALTGYAVRVSNQTIFRVLVPGNQAAVTTNSFIPALLFSLSIVCVLAFIYSILPRLREKNAGTGFLFLLIMFLVLRIVMVVTGFPGVFSTSRLFDPQVFAVSAINSSLGDLLFNMICALALSIYVFRNYFNFGFQHIKSTKAGGLIIGTVSALIMLFAGLFPVIVIQTLYNNSSIAIDISQSIQFDELRIVAILSALMSGMIAFFFSHAFIRTLAAINRPFTVFLCFAIAAVLFALINELSGQEYRMTLVLMTIYFLLVYLSGLSRNLKRLSFKTFVYLFTTILIFSANGAFSIQHFTHSEKIENQFRFASNFLIERDFFAEYLLDEAASKIAADAFVQSRINNPFLGKEPVRQKIRQYFLPSYFNKYDVKIYIYNSVGDAVDNSPFSLSKLLSLYDKDAFKTKYDAVRFVDNPEADVAQKYLVIVPVNRLGLTSAHVVIELELKKIIPESVYPELLVDHSFQTFYRTQDLSYAVFTDRKSTYTSGEFNYERFNFQSMFGDPALYTTGMRIGNYDHIAVEDQSGRIAVVSSKEIPFSYKLANFSFLFVLGLLIILLLVFILGIYQYFRGSRLFFSARIQLYLNLAFFLPLIIVSISTLGLTNRSSLQQLNDEYLSKSKTFGQQMANFIEESQKDSVDNIVSVQNHLSDLAKLSNLDANIYDETGVLLATSQPLIFETNLLSGYMNPRALERVKKGETIFIESETVGKLEYFVSYSVLKSSQSRELLGILGIPFFQSAHLMERIQTSVLINILNIFAFIFIILLSLSYLVADRLIFPLRFITQSLRRTSFTKNNTPLKWAAQDEIGFMVREYNSMLYKLSESKSELEHVQREKAWREIAQQVAHEIKNPLTPMKLTLQQLERALQSGNNSEEKIQKAITTILGQVDTLNEIASSFSGFVKMPDPVIRKIDILQILRRTVDLHSPTGEIEIRASAKEAWVMADEQLMSRTFSNIILNALQASVPGRSSVIGISLEQISGFWRIVFKDNGRGIAREIADRVFLAHFSTKKTGSGLGLAIAKQGIEQLKGRIWFETIEGEGTTFFIELPGAES